MSLIIDAYGSSVGGGDVIAIVERDHERVLSVEAPWQEALLRSMRAGSAGVVVLVSGYVPYLPHVGTSPTVFDNRTTARGGPVPAPNLGLDEPRQSTLSSVLSLSSADQALEVLAALSLNKTQLAEVLGVSRPTLYDWLEGKEPNASNALRLATLARVLASAGVTSVNPISPRFVRQPLNEGESSLLELLKADVIDVQLVAKVLREAKVLEDAAESRRVAREQRLAALGFEEPSDEQRKENLARDAAIRDWPKD